MNVWELSFKTNNLLPYSKQKEFLEKRCNSFEENIRSVMPTKIKEMKRNINESRKCLEAVGAIGSKVSGLMSFSIKCPVCS